MNDEDMLDLYELDDEIRGFPRIKNVPPPRNRRARHTWPKRPDLSIVTEEDDRAELKFTYRAAKSEALWLSESLGYFYQQHWFDDVLRILKGGKEASVYQCQANSSTGRPVPGGQSLPASPLPAAEEGPYLPRRARPAG